MTTLRWRAETGANGATTPGTQRVQFKKLKCCNYLVLPIVKLRTHAAWILFLETFFGNTGFYVRQCQ